jgi:hypothetical protein
MDTNPLLARRAISRKERLQKSLSCLLVTALAVSLAWVFAGGSLDGEPVYLIAAGSVALLGLCFSAYFWFKKEEMAHTKEESRFIKRRIEDDRAGRSWISRIGYNTRRFLSGIIVFVGILSILAGLGVLGLQIYAYLKFGEWGSVSVLGTASPYWPWLKNPQMWFGLHKIVRDAFGIMPLSLAFVLVGWLIAGFGSALRERATNRGHSAFSGSDR